jgi:hypothetical protein
VDLAARNSIRERRCKLPGGVWADIVQLDMFQLKVLRVFAWFGGPDDQPRVVTDDFVDEDLDCAMTLTGSFRTLPPHLTGRDVDFERIDVHGPHMHRLDEKPDESRVKGEVFHRDERLTCPGGDNAVRRKDAQVIPGNLESAQNRDTQVIELNMAIKSRT